MWRELTVIEQCKFSINENNNRSKLTNVVLFLGLILIGSIILSGAVSAAGLNTSPQPKFHHDNNNTGQSQYRGPQTNTTKWKYIIRSYIESSPAIGKDGTIYIGSYDNNLYAVEDLTASASPNGGFYNTNETVTLSMNHGGTIYFTLDGSNPTTSSSKYITPITIINTTILKYLAVDLIGNRSPIYSETYTVDKVMPTSITINQLLTGAKMVKTYYESFQALPSNITVNGQDIALPLFLQYMVTGTININSDNLNSLTSEAVNPPTSPSGTFQSGNILKSEYLIIGNIQNYINTNHRAPNYVNMTP